MSGFVDVSRYRPEPTGLVRPRLLDPLLSEDAPGVVVVIAPAGSGKTTLLSRAAVLSPRSVIWLEATPEQRTGQGFVRSLAGAVNSALGLDLPEPACATDLVSALADLHDQRILLVLDDVHELDGSSAGNDVAELLRWRPRHVRVALGTRRPLVANTARLMVSGELVELDSEALRFRSWEVEELFRLVYGEPLSPEAAAALTRRTGGWAAGLMLFHLSTTGKSAVDRERAVADLGGRSRLIRTYLTRTVLDELDPERREFLLATCTLGTLSGPLCDRLLGHEGSAGVLEDLASRQFFTTVAENGLSYRYHQVLQTLLEGLLVDELGVEAATDLYARSACLLEAEGLVREALRAYAMADDFASVGRLVQQSTAGLATDLDLVTADRVCDDPWLALVRARRLVRSGAFAAAVDAFRAAEGLLDDSEFRRRCAEERAVAGVWLADAAPQPTVPGARTARSVSATVRAATRKLPPPDRVPTHPLAGGVVLLLAGEFTAACQRLAEVPAASAAEQLFADLARVVAEIADGRATRSVATLEQIILTAEVEEQPWVARAARGVQSAVLLATTGASWRVDSCESLIRDCRRFGDSWGEMLLTGALGAALALCDDRGADRWLAQAVHEADVLDAPVLGAWAEALRAHVPAHADDADATARVERARSSARSAGLHPPEARIAGWLERSPAAAAPVPHGVVVRCLGPFEIVVDGTVATLPRLRPLPRALLLLLALDLGHDVHREVLIDRLWPDVPLDAATHRLHAAASSVRRCLADAGLGDDVVRRHGSAYSLSIEGAVLDVAELESRLREAARCAARGDDEGALGAHVRALEAYRGDLLGEVGPAEWVVADRDRLRVAAATAAYAAGEAGLRLRSPAYAMPFVRRAIQLDPLRDSAWALLAEIQEGMGDVSSAAATRQEHELVEARLTGP
ncbi:transcriptional regulator [Nocardioides guangzhouensis]|uniref:Transcriptional regulator n=1 Tax=Nocardioides guangzhouensis TaxID=2497878 RepID=A0A4Q4Z644_9ACTN|nr:AAA family ATPase [Nocardioides guangzhouensis]RYP83270.1 transcriptional regulator [Nocardioides guangzhouensis]